MYDILKGPSRWQRFTPALPHARQAKESLRHAVDKTIAYRRREARRLPSQHPLTRLLDSLNVPLRLSDESYVEQVGQVAFKVTNPLKMTSAWGPGKVFEPGWCYGPGFQEVVIATVDSFNIPLARANWEELEPIRVLTHPIADFTLPHLDGHGEGIDGGGLVVLTVNVPMLAFQHRCWWERYVKDNPDSPPGMDLFFQAYPLANLLRGHLDLTLANRFEAYCFDQDFVLQDDPNPFYVNFQVKQVDAMFNDAKAYMQRTNLTFDDWLSVFPMVYVEDYHDRLALPDLAFITQVEWAIFLARLPVLQFLVQWNAQLDSRYNRSYLNQITHWVRRMKNGRLFGHGLRGETASVVLDRIDQTIVPYL